MFWKIFFSLIFILTTNIFSSWEKDYLLALKKYGKKDYNEAIKLFEKAIKSKSNSCERCIREGMFFYDYFPHFYLAKCYLALNDKENFQKSIDFLKNEGLILKNAKLQSEFQILQYALPKEEIVEKPKQDVIEKPKEEKVSEKPKEEKVAEKPKEEKAVELPKEKKVIEKPKKGKKEIPKIFYEIAEVENQSKELSVQNYPKINNKRMEFSGELIFLKKKWNESKDEKERKIIFERAINLKNKFTKLVDLLKEIEKIKTLKIKIREKIEFFEKNREKISKEDFKKIQSINNLISKDPEEINLKELENLLSEIFNIKIIEKKLEFNNLKQAYIQYFEGKFNLAKNSLKLIPEEEKLSPLYDFLNSLIDLTNYLLNEKKDKEILINAKDSYFKAKEKGLKLEDIKKIPISPKILEIINSFN